MRRLEGPLDQERSTVTYELDDGRRATFDARAVQQFGLAQMMEVYGIEMPTKRIPVIHHGRRVGTMAPDFDPLTARSISFMYDVRSGDFRRDGDTWVAANNLGPGDLDCVAGFSRATSGLTFLGKHNNPAPIWYGAAGGLRRCVLSATCRILK